jgi:uncharacterized membrane protein
MPYCTQCANPVSDTARFCGRCGAPQAGAATPPASADFLRNMSPRTASILCYIPFFGWIAAIIVLASLRFRDNRDVRFHAFQGLYLFVAWLIVDQVIHPWFGHWPGTGDAPTKILQLGIIVAWILMLIKTSRSEFFSLPIFGELAAKSVSEQK